MADNRQMAGSARMGGPHPAASGSMAASGSNGPGPLGQSWDRRAIATARAAAARFRALSPAERKRLLTPAGLLVACVLGLMWYGSRPDWQTLYGGLDSSDERAMAAELTSAHIPFEISHDGSTIQVQAPDLAKARLAVTANGGPESGQMGFEIFDKPNWIGSEFDEHVNYQRALEGQLAHTIDSLRDVESSEVNLVMPHDSLFAADQRDAKASVVLTLRSHTLTDSEATAIRNLVAASVDDLKPQNVTLLDAAGEQLGMHSAGEQAETHEQELAAKLIQTLEPVTGPGNVRASVNVEYDTASSDEVDKTYDPKNVVALSMQRSQRTSGASAGASSKVAGVPGTATNAPNTKAPVYPQSAPQNETESEENGTYGASEKAVHTVEGAGRVERITAAVLIDQVAKHNGKSITWQPRSPQEMQRLTDLARAAIGYDAARGDTVTVVDLPFDSELPSPPSFAQRLLERLSNNAVVVKYAVVLAAFLALLFFAVRPMLKMLKPLAVQAALKAPTPEPRLDAAAEPLSSGGVVARLQKERMQHVFDEVTDRLKQEPAQGTRLLQGWIHNE